MFSIMVNGQRKRKKQYNDDVIGIEDEDQQCIDEHRDKDKDKRQENCYEENESLCKERPLWDEVKVEGPAMSGKSWRCRHCGKRFSSSYTRVHEHFFGPKPNTKSNIIRCPAFQKSESSKVHSQLKQSTLSQPQQVKTKNPMMESFNIVERACVDSAIVRWLCACGVPFNVLQSPFFRDMVSAIKKSPEGYEAPSFEEARTSLLDEEKRKVENEIVVIKDKWNTRGVSIVSDGWTNVNNQPLINVLAANEEGAMFLYAVESSSVEKTDFDIKSLLLEAIEKVGPSNVIQIITDNAANCKQACKEVEKVYQHIFWSPCVCQTLSLIFKDLLESWNLFASTYKKCKTIVKYIIDHAHALAKFRSQSPLELLKVTKIRFTSYYVVMKRVLDVRQTLISTVILDDWKEWAKHGDEKMRETTENVEQWVRDAKETFWPSVSLMIKITKPIHQMIKFCDKNGPLMGEVYERMDDMIGEIKVNLQGADEFEKNYEMVHEIIQTRWIKMHSPLYSLGFALMPRFYDASYLSALAPGGEKRKPPNEDRKVVIDVMEAFKRLAQDNEAEAALRKQFAKFHTKGGLYGTSEAQADAITMTPIEWWSTYGCETPQLADIAKKVLSQPISSSLAGRSWSTYSFIYNVKRNGRSAERADKLVFIHSNLRLLSRIKEGYNDELFKNWDVDPELALIDDSSARLEELRWKSLDDESQLQNYSASNIEIQSSGTLNVVATHSSLAYVQQPESNRLKLIQPEQELQPARQQDICISSSGDQCHSMSENAGEGQVPSELIVEEQATMIDYVSPDTPGASSPSGSGGSVGVPSSPSDDAGNPHALRSSFDSWKSELICFLSNCSKRWLEEYNRQIGELLNAVDSDAGDAKLLIIVDGLISHYDDLFRLNGIAAKADVFHVVLDMWTPERDYMWIGGFSPSKLLEEVKFDLIYNRKPLTELQLRDLCNLQQSSQQAEHTISREMEESEQSLEGWSANLPSFLVAKGRKHIVFEGYLQKADNLRQQTLKQMHQKFTTRQSAMALLSLYEYFYYYEI